MQQVKDIPWLCKELVNKKFVEKFIDDSGLVYWKCYKCEKRWQESIKYRFFRNTLGCKPCNGLDDKPSKLCISPFCKTRASFGTIIPIYCKSHKKDEDINLRNRKCKAPGCLKQPSFGTDKVEFCFEHSDPNFKNLSKINCKWEGCNTGRISKASGYCIKHSEGGDPYKKKCEASNCDTRCSFGFPNEKPKRCSIHILPGMIDVVHKKCINVNCDIIPAFNYKYEKAGIYCAEHAFPGMINVVSKKCLDETCETIASHNYIGKSEKLYCRKHAFPDMICVTTKKCEAENCFISASFGHSKEEGAKRCAEHKEDDMYIVNYKFCKFPNCKRRAIYNFPDLDKPEFCNEHRDKNTMIDVVSKKCEEKDCNTFTVFGYHGLGKTHCSKCKKNTMIRNPNRKCEVKYCQVLATHGIPDPLESPFENQAKRCYHHANKDDIDIYSRECIKCGLKQTLDLDNICYFCNPKNNLQHLHREEIRVKEYLIEHGITDGVYDKVIDSGVCGKERPDILFDCGFYWIDFECDEGQHDRASYGCEITRMHNIWNMLALPTIFIRYNPHKYSSTVGGKRLPGENHGTRLEYLLKWIQYLKSNKPQNNLSVVYLFYDGPYNGQILKLVE